MVCIISYIDESELEVYRANIEPHPLTITTVNATNRTIKRIMWLKYEMGGKKKVILTIVMHSYKSYFIIGINFWNAFDIQCTWGRAQQPTHTIAPWNEDIAQQVISHLGSKRNQLNTQPITLRIMAQASHRLEIAYRIRYDNKYAEDCRCIEEHASVWQNQASP